VLLWFLSGCRRGVVGGGGGGGGGPVVALVFTSFPQTGLSTPVDFLFAPIQSPALRGRDTRIVQLSA